MIDVAVLILRIAAGALLAGHGAQKIFGLFGGPGPRGTREMIASLGLRPAWLWVPLAGLTELGGGFLTILGLLSPLGPLGILASMAIAIFRAHRGKPLWATAGGAELPVLYSAVVIAVAVAGPGRYSVDAALGIVLPPALVWAAVAAVAVGVIAALASSSRPGARQESERDRRAA